MQKETDFPGQSPSFCRFMSFSQMEEIQAAHSQFRSWLKDIYIFRLPASRNNRNKVHKTFFIKVYVYFCP